MKIKVLVVDDNAVQVSLLKKYFNESEDVIVVDSALDGEEAINKLNSDFDIMILDLVMPKKDGISVLEYMKENNIDKKVIVTTAFNEDETIRKVSEYGVKYYCLKPFELDYLKNIIINIAKSSRSKNELL